MNILILFGSETGTAQYEAESLALDMVNAELEVELFSCDSFPFENFLNYEFVIILISTTG